MLAVIEGRNLGVVESDYTNDAGSAAKAYKLQVLQPSGHGIVDIRLNAKSSSQLEQCRALGDLQDIAVEVTVYRAEMKPRRGGSGEYLAEARYTFASLVPLRGGQKVRAAA